MDEINPHVCIAGNLSEGFRVIGLYSSFDVAADNHPGGDTWIVPIEIDSKSDLLIIHEKDSY